MFKKAFLLVFFITLISCNDGDVFVTELDFPETLEYCEGNNDLIIYSIKENPYESLSVKLPASATSNFTTAGDFSSTLTSSNTFNYRTYSGDPSNIFCNSLPPTSPTILSNSEASNGTVIFTTTLEEDDNDGIPANLEDDNIDGDNDYLTNPRDTDNDGIPDYLDSDDDGDNVPTSNENPDPNNDGDLSDALDTDLDGIPNYLDTDDDNDGIITRYEDTNNDNDPTNDITDPTEGPDFLNSNITVETINDTYKNHTKNQSFECKIVIENMLLINAQTNETLISDTYVFGTINTSINSLSYEVDFN